VSDGRFGHIEALFEFLFESRKLLSPFLLVAKQRLAHFQKRPDNEHSHLHGARAVQYLGRHYRAMFRENPREILSMLAAARL
jgi:hypothetical protein